MRWLPLVLLFGACAGNTLAQDDSNAVMGQLVAVSVTAMTAAQPHPNAAPPLVLSIDQTVACAAGGSAEVSGELSGDVDPATGTGTYSIDLMTTFSDCNVGNGMIVNGAPYLSTTGMFSFQSYALSGATITYSGAVTANGDTCNVDLGVAGLGPRGVSSATGTICGHAVRSAYH